MTEPGYREVWVEGPEGQRICALIHRDRGWLMYLSAPGDAGFSSRNPAYDGPEDAVVDFVLSNGQRDAYPASWVLPSELIERALDYVRSDGSLPPFVAWHDDSEAAS